MLLKRILTLMLCTISTFAMAQLIPQPNEVVERQGNFVLTPKTKWIVPDANVSKAAEPLMNQLNLVSGWSFQPTIGTKAGKNSVLFVVSDTLPAEGYTLQVSASHIRIEASDANGFFYATQTLRQLLPEAVEYNYQVVGQEWSIPCVKISDNPRFGYRGFMLDVSRHFIPKQDIIRLLDLMALHKLNYFHWHLIDDNGWRLEIKRYPRLTDVGAWRVDRSGMFSLRANPEPGETTPVGGYYTQDDVREIVAYAQARSIQVIPEIEMPAHTNASLAAYPHLACPVVEHWLGVLPGIGGRHAAAIYCAGNDTVFEFLQHVLDEVMELFPCEYIHIGGDEADKLNWKKCPKCQARMVAESLDNEEELQSYFIKRINKYIQSKGKRLMGWDELVESTIPDNAIIHGWRGMGLGADEAAMQGFDYIKSPAQRYYFIRYQGPQWFEPFTYFGNTTLRDVYSYEPLPEDVHPMLKKHMLGVEACLWSEFINNTADADYQIFPRLAAFAETAWSDPKQKEWEHFLPRMDKMVVRYEALGVNYARSMYNLDHKVEPANRKLKVTLSSIRPDMEIRYTMDGSEPQATSLRYAEPLFVEPTTVVRAATFKGGERKGRILPLNTISHQAAGCSALWGETHVEVLTNGLFGSEKLSDGEWLDVYNSDGEFVIDLNEVKTFSQISVGMLNNAGMGVHFPKEIEFLVSDNGVAFTSVKQHLFAPAESFQNGMFRYTHHFHCGLQTARYIKIKALNPGPSPAWLTRAGMDTRFAFDEVVVK